MAKRQRRESDEKATRKRAKKKVSVTSLRSSQNPTWPSHLVQLVIISTSTVNAVEELLVVAFTDTLVTFLDTYTCEELVGRRCGH